MLRRAARRFTATAKGSAAHARSESFVRNLEQHIDLQSGPASPTLSPEAPVVTTLFKNAKLHLRPFLEHHRSIGFAHFFLIDNGSTDGSADLLRDMPDVTVYHSASPFKDFKHAFRQYLVRKHALHRWSLTADIDEHFLYPHMDRLPLVAFLAYLDAQGYSAVMTHMLDMFPDAPLNSLPPATGDFRRDYPMYDVAALHREPYSHPYNRVANPDVMHQWGGISKAVFGIEDIYLSKMPLIKHSPKVLPHVTSHSSQNVDLADVSTVVLHYRFTHAFTDKVQQAIESNSHWSGSAVYKTYLRAMDQNPALSLVLPTSRRFENTEQLREDGLLVTSDAYEAWVRQHGRA